MSETSFQPGLPVANPTRSYWQTRPSKISDLRSTVELPSSSKYVIIGSGVTGAIIAHKLLLEDPSASIVMLEARQTCSGATGRNGGHCRMGNYIRFEEDVEKFGEAEASFVQKLEEANVQNVKDLIAELKIDCDWRERVATEIYTCPVFWGKVLAALKYRNEYATKIGMEFSEKYEIWSAEETKERLLVADAVGSIHFKAYTLQPYVFVCALLELCLEKGLNLQANTPVTKIFPNPERKANNKDSWIVQTERGNIVAEKAILATNAYTGMLYPPLARFIIPTRGQLVAIRPGSKIDGNPALERCTALVDSASFNYWQRRPDGTLGEGDLLIGGGRSQGTAGEHWTLDDATIHTNVSNHLKNVTPETFYGRNIWGDNGQVVGEWTGIMGYTADKQPIIGEAPNQKGLWICAGFNGHGMALTFQSAEALVQQMMGRQNEVDQWLPSCYKIERVVKASL